MLGGLSAFLYGVWRRFQNAPVADVDATAPTLVLPLGPLTVSPPTATIAPQKPVEPEGLDTFARTLWGEARGDGTRGMEAVAAVIMNRVRSRRYPSKVAAVCLQKYQFSVWLEGDPNFPKMLAVTVADPNFVKARSIALRAMSGTLGDPTGGALHYYAKYIEPPYWADGATETAHIGKHIFLTGVA